jgi:hypothetical protein
MNYYFLTVIVTFYFVSVFLTIFGLILTNLLAILYMSSCNACLINGAIPIFWSIFALGIVSALIGAFFFVLGLLLIGASNDKLNKMLIKNKNYGRGFYNNPFSIFPCCKRSF